MFLHESTPGQQNSLILLKLFHEGRVWFGDGPFLFNVVKSHVQVPAVLLHSIGDHCGGRATHAHLTVNQTLSSSFPKTHKWEKSCWITRLRYQGELNKLCVRLNLLGFGDELVGFVPVLQQVGGLFVVHSDVVVLKHPREEVINLPGHIQNVTYPMWETGRSRLTYWPFNANKTVTGSYFNSYSDDECVAYKTHRLNVAANYF